MDERPEVDLIPHRVVNDFYTRREANEGRTFPLPLPNGEDSGETIKLVSSESDTFRRASAERARAGVQILAMPEDQRENAKYDADTRLLVACIVDWTLATPLTPQNAFNLLTEAPYIRDLVDTTITRRSAFFGRR